MVLFGIEPKELTTGLELTPEIEASLGRLVDAVAAELRDHGHRVEERPDPVPRRPGWEPPRR